jgi:integrase/recombinase XerD
MAGLELPGADWPVEDRRRLAAAFEEGDRFDEGGCGRHLADTTRLAHRRAYARLLTFILERHPARWHLAPHQRVDHEIIAQYVAWRRQRRAGIAMVTEIHHLRGAFRLICPENDWSWLLTIANRMGAITPKKPPLHNQVTSERLYALGIELMAHATDQSDAAGQTSKTHAIEYRDGLMIALMALMPLRRGTAVKLRLDSQLVKTGDQWGLDIPASDTKNRRALDYPIGEALSLHIDLYLTRFRGQLPGASRHNGVWASNKGRPMSSDALYAAVCRRTLKAFGIKINFHRFRHAAATMLSIHDPANVRSAKDLLGHASFATTELFYVMAETRLAGRVVAQIVDALRK